MVKRPGSETVVTLGVSEPAITVPVCSHISGMPDSEHTCCGLARDQRSSHKYTAIFS